MVSGVGTGRDVRVPQHVVPQPIGDPPVTSPLKVLAQEDDVERAGRPHVGCRLYPLSFELAPRRGCPAFPGLIPQFGEVQGGVVLVGALGRSQAYDASQSQ